MKRILIPLAILAAAHTATACTPVSAAQPPDTVRLSSTPEPTNTPAPTATPDTRLAETAAAISVQMTGTAAAQQMASTQMAGQQTEWAFSITQSAAQASATYEGATMEAMIVTQTQAPIAATATSVAAFNALVYQEATKVAELDDSNKARAMTLVWVERREIGLTIALLVLAVVVVVGVWRAVNALGDWMQARGDSIRNKDAEALARADVLRMNAEEAIAERQRRAAREHELARLKLLQDSAADEPVGHSEHVPSDRVAVAEPKEMAPIRYAEFDEYTGRVLRFLEQCAEISADGWAAEIIPPVSAWPSNETRGEGIDMLKYHDLVEAVRGNKGYTKLKGYNTLGGLRRDLESRARVVFPPTPPPAPRRSPLPTAV